jgi:hypothetical protein
LLASLLSQHWQDIIPESDCEFCCLSHLLASLLSQHWQDIIPESDCEFCCLSHLLASLLDLSLSQGQVEAVPVTVARERGVIPEASNKALQAFSFSEMKLYKHAIVYKWTSEEFIATIKLIKSTDFKVEDINVYLHKRVAAAIAQGHFTSYNMQFFTSHNMLL